MRSYDLPCSLPNIGHNMQQPVGPGRSCSPHNGEKAQPTGNSKGECKQGNGIRNERDMLFASQVHSVALRALEPPGLHGQGDALAALHQIGEEPAPEAQQHLRMNTILSLYIFTSLQCLTMTRIRILLGAGRCSHDLAV